MKTVKFLGYECVIEKSKYTNGRPTLILKDAHDGEQIAVATVNLPDVECGRNEVFIKDYSECEGMLTALEAAGVVKATGRFVHSGFVSVPSVELLPPFQERSHVADLLGLDSNEKKPWSPSRDTERSR